MKEELGLGMIMTIFITVVVGTVLLIAVAQSAGVVSQEGYSNGTTTGGQQIVPGVLGTVTCLTGQEILGATPTVANATAAYLAPNYTISEGLCPTTGVKSVLYTQDSNNGTTLTYNVTYSYGVDGYADNSGARGITTLIVIFMALAIAIVVLVPVLKSGVLEYK